jgi:hypothetical protein
MKDVVMLIPGNEAASPAERVPIQSGPSSWHLLAVRL